VDGQVTRQIVRGNIDRTYAVHKFLGGVSRIVGDVYHAHAGLSRSV
jgi:hypothetical protein